MNKKDIKFKRKQTKMIQKTLRDGWGNYFNEMCKLKFWNRLHFCWDLLRKHKFEWVK